MHGHGAPTTVFDPVPPTMLRSPVASEIPPVHAAVVGWEWPAPVGSFHSAPAPPGRRDGRMTEWPSNAGFGSWSHCADAFPDLPRTRRPARHSDPPTPSEKVLCVAAFARTVTAGGTCRDRTQW